jgi:hypothetical protein
MRAPQRGAPARIEHDRVERQQQEEARADEQQHLSSRRHAGGIIFAP